MRGHRTAGRPAEGPGALGAAWHHSLQGRLASPPGSPGSRPATDQLEPDPTEPVWPWLSAQPSEPQRGAPEKETDAVGAAEERSVQDGASRAQPEGWPGTSTAAASVAQGHAGVSEGHPPPLSLIRSDTWLYQDKTGTRGPPLMAEHPQVCCHTWGVGGHAQGRHPRGC